MWQEVSFLESMRSPERRQDEQQEQIESEGPSCEFSAGTRVDTRLARTSAIYLALGDLRLVAGYPHGGAAIHTTLCTAPLLSGRCLFTGNPSPEQPSPLSL